MDVRVLSHSEKKQKKKLQEQVIELLQERGIRNITVLPIKDTEPIPKKGLIVKG